MFAIIGMEAFHGKVRFFDLNFTAPDALVCGNLALKDSAFARDRYCRNNFNDLASSFVVLMELTVVNQWHNILPEEAVRQTEGLLQGALTVIPWVGERRVRLGVAELGTSEFLEGLVP